jgi:hypothetical protein
MHQPAAGGLVHRFEFRDHTPGGFMTKREPQIILKTDERKIHIELGLEGKFAAKSTGWDEKPGLPRRGPVGDRSQGRPLGADAPAAKPAAPKPVLHYWPDDE